MHRVLFWRFSCRVRVRFALTFIMIPIAFAFCLLLFLFLFCVACLLCVPVLYLEMMPHFWRRIYRSQKSRTAALPFSFSLSLSLPSSVTMSLAFSFSVPRHMRVLPLRTYVRSALEPREHGRWFPPPVV